MMSVEEAFKKFRSRLELSETEQTDVSRRQKEIRGHMAEAFDVDTDFLSGSYKRHTKAKPLKDVDIFCVLGRKERHYRDEPPIHLIDAVAEAMVPHYGREYVERNWRSVTVNFPRPPLKGGEERVLSFDIVPAFEERTYYEIPDTSPMRRTDWTKTDPKVHEELATEANKKFGGDWKALVRFMKTWNRKHQKPIRPSFLIEVMALELLVPPGGGDDRREMKAFFATMANGILRDWPDPAKLGPPVSDGMDTESRQRARAALLAAERSVSRAILLESQGKVGEALRVWRDEIFGERFAVT